MEVLQNEISSSDIDSQLLSYGDLGEIIDGLDKGGVDDLDLSQFLVEGGSYFKRDYALFEPNGVDPFADPFGFVSEPTKDIIKPLIDATSVMPPSFTTESQAPLENTHKTFAQYWGQKRSLDEMNNESRFSNITNLELPRSIPTAQPIIKQDKINELHEMDHSYLDHDNDEDDEKDSKKRKLTAEREQRKESNKQEQLLSYIDNEGRNSNRIYRRDWIS